MADGRVHTASGAEGRARSKVMSELAKVRSSRNATSPMTHLVGRIGGSCRGLGNSVYGVALCLILLVYIMCWLPLSHSLLSPCSVTRPSRVREQPRRDHLAPRSSHAARLGAWGWGLSIHAPRAFIEGCVGGWRLTTTTFSQCRDYNTT